LIFVVSSLLSTNPPRALMSGNEKSVDIYIKYVTEQISRHKLKERIQDIIDDL